MEFTRGHVIKLDPNREQEAYFRRACGVRRFVFNWALNQYEAWWLLYNENKKLKLPRPSGMTLAKYFNSVKRTFCPWVYDVSERICARAIADANDAYVKWFEALQRGDTQWGRPRRAR
jgi:putative transposase